MEQGNLSLLIGRQRVNIVLSLTVVELYFRQHLLLLGLLAWVLVFQLLRVFDERGSNWVKGLKDVKLPIKVSRCLVSGCSVWHLERRLVELVVLRVVGLGVEDELIQLPADILQSCFLVHLVQETVAQDVPVVCDIVVAVHDFDSFFHVFVILLCPLSVMVLRRYLELGQCLVNVVVPLCLIVPAGELVHVLVRLRVFLVADWELEVLQVQL